MTNLELLRFKVNGASLVVIVVGLIVGASCEERIMRKWRFPIPCFITRICAYLDLRMSFG